MHLGSLRRFPLLRLLLALALAAIWVRSHWRSDLLALFVNGGRVQLLGADRGRAIVALSNVALGPERAYTVKLLDLSNDEFHDVRELLYDKPPLPVQHVGAYVGGDPTDAFGLPGARYQYLVLPFAYPAGLAILVLGLGLRTFWLRRRWGSRGVCGGCGYDLRESPDRCPECGALPRNLTQLADREPSAR